MKISKQLTKEDLPKLGEPIKQITLAFDVSTTKTGYCFLINNKPMQIGQGNYISIGSIHMVKKEKYIGQVGFKDKTPLERQKPKEYTNYGDRLFWGSGTQIQVLGSIVADMFQQINPYYQKSTLITRPKITIVFEVSEIPNFNQNKGQSITTTRKLALYVGAVVQEIYNSIKCFGYFVAHEPNTEVKLIKPTEWQSRLWVKKGTTEKTKEESIRQANIRLKSWGLEETQDHDMADAINIAWVSSEVRDNLVVSTFNMNKKELTLKTLPRDIYNLQTKISQLTQKANDKYINHLAKVKGANKSKYNYDQEKARTPLEFLTKSEYERYTKLNNEKKNKLEYLTKLKGKVYDNMQ